MESKGTFWEFQDAMRGFESGFDWNRFKEGILTIWQFQEWAGDAWTDFLASKDSNGTTWKERMDEYLASGTSWDDLGEDFKVAWRDLQYHSENSLGFLGYQFGEALMIDMGYYEDNFFYGNGAGTNTWGADGTGEFLGKGGINSKSDFQNGYASTDFRTGVDFNDDIFKGTAFEGQMHVQEITILDAFSFNLQVIVNGLAGYKGHSSGVDALVKEFLGQQVSYNEGGQTKTITMTLTGLLAAAHLRGAWGATSLLKAGAVSTDENGTSILRYVDLFGGYEDYDAVTRARLGISDYYNSQWDSLSADQKEEAAVVALLDRFDYRAVDTSGSLGGGGDSSLETLKSGLKLEWSWGLDQVIGDGNPENGKLYGVDEDRAFTPYTTDADGNKVILDKIDFDGQFGKDDINLVERNGHLIIEILFSGVKQQSYKLYGIKRSDLTVDHFINIRGSNEFIKDFFGIETDNTTEETIDVDGEDLTVVKVDDDTSTDTGSGGSTDNEVSVDSTNTIKLAWAWGKHIVVSDFTASEDGVIVSRIDFANLFQGADVRLHSNAAGDFMIYIVSPDGVSYQDYTFTGVKRSDLTAANFINVIGNRGFINDFLNASETQTPDTGGGDTAEDTTAGDTTDNDGGDTAISYEPDVIKASDVIEITWKWNTREIIKDFDVTKNVIDFGWFFMSSLKIYQKVSADQTISTVIEIPSNKQFYILEGVSFADLYSSNAVAANDRAFLNELLNLLKGETDTTGEAPVEKTDGENTIVETSDGVKDELSSSDKDTNGDVVVKLEWSWGTDFVFDVKNDISADDLLIDLGWFVPNNFDIFEKNGAVVIMIDGNDQTYTFDGISLSDLDRDNFRTNFADGSLVDSYLDLLFDKPEISFTIPV